MPLPPATQIRLLGEVDVTLDGVSRRIAGQRRKAVLAVLALNPGEVVSTDRLTDVVWGQNPPATVGNTLQSHISYLRGVLDDRTAIVGRRPGYLLDRPAEAIDVGAVRALLRRDPEERHDETRAAALHAALAYWRGPSLADLTDVPWLRDQGQRLDLLRLETRQALVETRLALGDSSALVPELQQLVEQHPFREDLYRQLMLALYRGGRQVEALATYQRLRDLLARELGIDPSPPLRDLEADILRQSTGLALPSPVTAGVGIPAQLPRAVPNFTGRRAELAQLDALLPGPDPDGDPRPAPVAVSAISGPAGIGKTALAVHWAHQVADQFPDGQLYVNLRGFDPGGPAMQPAEALRGFLPALGIPLDQLPSGLDAQASHYRSALAGKRVLIVLDNAHGAAQVRPLLPGTAGCLVLVTSRDRLTGLVAVEGAQPLALDLPSTVEARLLLTRRLGSRRFDLDAAATDEIVARCGRLPLALVIAAARAATSPGRSLAALAAELRDCATGLDQFRGGDLDDPATDLRAVLSWSYRTVRDEPARLFRLLGLLPSPDFSLAVAASAAGRALWPTRELVSALTSVHLLGEFEGERYRSHDLVHRYAREQAERLDSADDRLAAQRRMLDHYLHTAYRAALLLDPERDPLALAEPAPGVTLTELGTADEALAWFVAEDHILFRIVTEPPAGLEAHGWQMAWVLHTFLDRMGYLRDNAAVQEAGLEAARATGDRRAQAYAHLSLGAAVARLGRSTETAYHVRQAHLLLAGVVLRHAYLDPKARVQVGA